MWRSSYSLYIPYIFCTRFKFLGFKSILKILLKVTQNSIIILFYCNINSKNKLHSLYLFYIFGIFLTFWYISHNFCTLFKILRFILKNTIVDPHFSRASPLDRRDSLFICEKLFSFGKVGATTYFIFILKGK